MHTNQRSNCCRIKAKDDVDEAEEEEEAATKEEGGRAGGRRQQKRSEIPGNTNFWLSQRKINGLFIDSDNN